MRQPNDIAEKIPDTLPPEEWWAAVQEFVQERDKELYEGAGE